MTSGTRHPALFGALWSLGVALVWTTLAALNPTTNYHLSPLITVLAAPMAARVTNSGRPPWPTAIATVGVGVTVAVAAATIIHVAGWARGPTFSSTVTSLAELVTVIVVGALVGAVITGALIVATQPPFAGGNDQLVLLMFELHSNGYVLGGILFGLWLLPVGLIALRSPLFRRGVGIVLISGAIAWILSTMLAFVPLERLEPVTILTIPMLVANLA